MRSRILPALVMLLFATGCSGSGGTTTEVPPGTSPAPTTTVATTAAPPSTTTPAEPGRPPEGDGAVLNWEDSSQRLELDGGWVVAACEGEAPLVCVGRDGVAVGTLEATSYPIDGLPYWDPAVDAQTNLEAVAADYHAVFAEDRPQGCGADYGFETLDPRPFVLGGTPGLAYGFAGTMPDGSPSELHLQYAAVVDDRVVSILAAAYDEGGCPGPDGILVEFSSEVLREFQAHLETLLGDSPLPAV